MHGLSHLKACRLILHLENKDLDYDHMLMTFPPETEPVLVLGWRVKKGVGQQMARRRQ